MNGPEFYVLKTTLVNLKHIYRHQSVFKGNLKIGGRGVRKGESPASADVRGVEPILRPLFCSLKELIWIALNLPSYLWVFTKDLIFILTGFLNFDLKGIRVWKSL